MKKTNGMYRIKVIKDIVRLYDYRSRTETETDRQTDRQIERQTDRRRASHTDRQK